LRIKEQETRLILRDDDDDDDDDDDENQRDAPFSQIYFWNTTLHVSDRFSVHHQESSTVNIARGMSYRLC
jgi:hypothetical protein